MWGRFVGLVLLCFTAGTASGVAQVSGPTCFGLPATIVGTEGDDVITGTPGPDVIVALGGDDAIVADSGDDRICAGPGNDLVIGQDGNDMIDGGPGVDGIEAGAGDDTIIGGPADSADADLMGFLLANQGVVADLQTGVATGEGRDTMTHIEALLGSRFDDTLTGNAGPNELDGLGGNDEIHGGAGPDLLEGDYVGPPLDIVGPPGLDQLDGGPGDDTLFGGPAADVLRGGDGQDDTVSYIDSRSGVHVDLAANVAVGEGHDRLIGVESVAGSPFADSLIGNGRPNELFGNAGNDTLVGAAGADFLGGGNGADTARAGPGTDYCLADETTSGCEILGAPAIAAGPEPPPLSLQRRLAVLLSALARRREPARSERGTLVRKTAAYEYSAEPVCIASTRGGVTQIAPPSVVLPVGNDGAPEEAWWRGTLFRRKRASGGYTIVQAKTPWARGDLGGATLLPGGIVVWKDVTGRRSFQSPTTIRVPRGRFLWVGQIYWVRSGGKIFAAVEPHIIRARTIRHDKDCAFG